MQHYVDIALQAIFIENIALVFFLLSLYQLDAPCMWGQLTACRQIQRVHVSPSCMGVMHVSMMRLSPPMAHVA